MRMMKTGKMKIGRTKTTGVWSGVKQLLRLQQLHRPLLLRPFQQVIALC
jgi:hypothetical protein